MVDMLSMTLPQKPNSMAFVDAYFYRVKEHNRDCKH